MDHRILGVSETEAIANTFWLAISGNNLSLQFDTLRRAILANFSSTSDNPESLRFTFHPLDVVTAERTELLEAVFCILRYGILGHIDHGSTLGSFEEWSKLIVDVLVDLDCPNLIDEITASRRSSDDFQQLAEFIWAFWNAHGEAQVRVKDFHVSVKSAAWNLVGRGKSEDNSALGTRLRARNLAAAEGFRMHHEPQGSSHRGGGIWWLEWTGAASLLPERNPPVERERHDPIKDAKRSKSPDGAEAF
jgi:hypothetical protein